MKVKKQKLHIYVLECRDVEYSGNPRAWILCHQDGAIADLVDGGYSSKQAAISKYSAGMKEAYVDFGQCSELRIRNLDGTFAPSRTYPRSRDPKSSKG